MGVDPKLIMLRGQLDKIDEQIISLFGERRAVIQNVAQFKKEQGVPVFDPQREEKVFHRVRVLAEKNQLDPEGVEEIFRSIVTFFRTEEAKDLGKDSTR